MTKLFQPPPLPDAGWAYFLDFDGTLVDIAPRPEDVRVSSSLRELLFSVAAVAGGALAVVSGRSLADLDRHLSMPELCAAGTHGVELRGCHGPKQAQSEKLGSALDAVRAAAQALIAAHPRIRIEDKGGAVAIHFRAAPEAEPFVIRHVKEVVEPFGGALSVLCGKMVVEVKPAGASKAGAVELFLQEPAFAGRRPCFIGDDVTDEDGFRACNAYGGVSIQVGGGKAETAAHFHLESPDAVHGWLAHLIPSEKRIVR